MPGILIVKLYSKKIIVIADKLQDIGGGETVLAQICEALNPDFVLTSTVNKNHNWEKFLGVTKIVTPFWGRFVRNRFIWFLLYPAICFLMSRIKVNSDDSVLVYSSTVSKYVKVRSSKRIVLYSNYPARGIFFPQEFFKSKVILFLVRPLVAAFRGFEARCIRKYENIYVISEACQKAYKNQMEIDSIVLNCPTDNVFSDYYDQSTYTRQPEKMLSGAASTFVLVSRLVDWKNLNYVFEYFEQQEKLKLNVIGGGPLLDSYRKKYQRNCRFLGYLPVNEKLKIMRASCGLVFPSVQEWSLVTIEANSLGLPVLGVSCGATNETQITFLNPDASATCLTYDKPTLESLSCAMDKFVNLNWDSAFIHDHSRKFSPAVFREKMIKIVNE